MRKARIRLSGVSEKEIRNMALFAQAASRFRSNIWIAKGDRRANGKSVLSLMALASIKDGDACLLAEGTDEETAVKHLSGLFD